MSRSESTRVRTGGADAVLWPGSESGPATAAPVSVVRVAAAAAPSDSRSARDMRQNIEVTQGSASTAHCSTSESLVTPSLARLRHGGAPALLPGLLPGRVGWKGQFPVGWVDPARVLRESWMPAAGSRAGRAGPNHYHRSRCSVISLLSPLVNSASPSPFHLIPCMYVVSHTHFFIIARKIKAGFLRRGWVLCTRSRMWMQTRALCLCSLIGDNISTHSHTSSYVGIPNG